MAGIKKRLGSLLGPKGRQGPQGVQGVRGLPGVDAVPADAAVSTYIMEQNTASRAAVETVLQDSMDSLGALKSQDFNNIVLGTNRDEYLPPGTIAFYYTPKPVLFTDFSDASTGGTPEDWSHQWSYFDWRITPHNGKNILIVEVPAGGGEYSGLAWDAVEELLESNNGDGEIVLKHLSTNPTIPLRVLIGGSGETGSEDGFFGNVRNASFVQLGKLSQGSMEYVGESAQMTTDAEWLVTRLRKQGNQILGKTWLNSADEPEEWQTQLEDPNIRAGWWGLHARGYSGSLSATLWVDWIGFAAGDHTAPKGLT